MPENEQEEAAINELIERVEGWMLEGCFELVDQWLSTLIIEQLTPGALLAVLSSVHPGRNHLKNRDAFVLKAAEVFLKGLRKSEQSA